MPHHLILWAVLALAASFQIYVTVRIWTSKMFSAREKANQTKVVWLVPAFGAALVFAFISEEEKHFRSDVGSDSTGSDLRS